MNKPYSQNKSGNKDILNSASQEIKYTPELKTVNRKYEDEMAEYVQNDLTQFVYQLAVWSDKHKEIYKLSGIDFRGQRFDLSGERMTRWVRFNDAVLFNFCNEEEFNHYYKLYLDAKVAAGARRVTSQHNMFSWLAHNANRLSGAIPLTEDEETQNKLKETLNKEAEEKLSETLKKRNKFDL